ncbi:hypothetical protein SALBM311S_10243 [Streptomyces alboniger]
MGVPSASSPYGHRVPGIRGLARICGLPCQLFGSRPVSRPVAQLCQQRQSVAITNLCGRYGQCFGLLPVTIPHSLQGQEIRGPVQSLRHAGVSLWLESGVSPGEVARRAGRSIAVLFRFYAKAIHRNQQRSTEQIRAGP